MFTEEEKIPYRKIYKLKEEDKYCFKCNLIDCIDRHPDCARKKVKKEKRNNKKIRGTRF